MRVNKQAQSLNYFNCYAVKDRIDSSSLSSFKSSYNESVNVADILPSAETHTQLQKNIAIIISRILVENIPAVKLYFEDVVELHIAHEHSSDMSKKSEVVCHQ